MNRGINPDEGPMLQVHETDFGFIYGGRRNTHNNQEGKYYWRLTPFVLPTLHGDSRARRGTAAASSSRPRTTRTASG